MAKCMARNMAGCTHTAVVTTARAASGVTRRRAASTMRCLQGALGNDPSMTSECEGSRFTQRTCVTSERRVRKTIWHVRERFANTRATKEEEMFWRRRVVAQVQKALQLRPQRHQRVLRVAKLVQHARRRLLDGRHGRIPCTDGTTPSTEGTAILPGRSPALGDRANTSRHKHEYNASMLQAWGD